MLQVPCAWARSEFGIPTDRERQGPNEIEHKYLVLKSVEALNLWCFNGRASCHPLKNAFFNRIAGNRAYLTAKGPATGVTRLEFAYPIPIDDGAAVLDLRAAANRKDTLP